MNTTIKPQTTLASHLYCSNCNKNYDIEQLQNFSTCCIKPLLTAYHNLQHLSKEILITRDSNMWRYHELLPLFDIEKRVTLGEGMTPILPMKIIGNKYGFDQLWVKDEGVNPTGSFKARGISMAISEARTPDIRDA